LILLLYLLVIIPYPLVGGLGDFLSIMLMRIFLSFGLTPGVYVLFSGSFVLG
jgi:hypothetical protein